MRTGALGRAGAGQNTTIGVVATNAPLPRSKPPRWRRWRTTDWHARSRRCTRRSDGDTIFAIATAGPQADLLRVGALAAEVMADAVVRAVRQATGIPGYPAARDLGNK